VASRRIKVRGNDQRVVLGMGAVTGVGLALRGLSPTGSATIDWLLLVLVGTGAVWASASAPWWALSGVAGVGAAIAPPVLPIMIGVGVFLLSLAVGVIRRSQPIERAAVAGAAMLVLSMARELRWFGISSLIGIALVVGVAGLGLWRRPRREQRLAILVLGAAATIAAIGVLGLVVAGTSARPDLSEGNKTARQGLRELESGDFDLAQVSFERAASAFERADGDMGAVWAQPARLVPIAGQHRNAGADISSAAASATRTIEQQLRLVDLNSLRIVDGRIDIDAVKALQAPMTQLQAALDELEQAVTVARSGWLANPIQRRLDDLAAEISDQQQLGAKAVAALDVAPAMLGEDGQRVYFVMFTTPAEARGQGGFMGNYAELTITDGNISMTAFGRHTDLNQAGDRPRKLVNAPQDWLARYGPFGFQKGPDMVVGEVPWSNITMSPNFPSTAQVVAELYPQSGGQAIDGVISLDVFALEQLVGLVGPIEVDGAPEPLTGSNTSQFLLFDQYFIEDHATRTDMLEQVARTTFERLLGGAAPAPLDLGRAMAPMVRQRRMYVWSAVGTEQSMLESAAMSGGLLSNLNGGDGIAVSVVNASGSKIDSFLDRDYELVVESDGADARTATLTLRLGNDSPDRGYPDYVIGNLVGLPVGSSRLYVTISTTMSLDTASLNGAPIGLHPASEAGLSTYSIYIDVPSNNAATLELELLGLQGTGDWVILQPQPLVRPERWTLTIAGTRWPVAELGSIAEVRLGL